MKLIVNPSNDVLYVGAALQLTAQGAVLNGGTTDSSTTTSNALLVDIGSQAVPADFTGGFYKYANGAFVATAAQQASVTAALAALKASLSAQLDTAVIKVYDKPTTLGEEYKEREAQAQAYKDAGYPEGEAPPRVLGIATPAGMTAHAATDLILSQAAMLRGALGQLSDLRMQKYTIARAADAAAAQAAFDSAMAQVRAIAAAIA